LAEQLKNSGQHQLITISTKTLQPHGVSVIDGWLYHGSEKLYDCTTHPYLKGVHNFENIAAVFATATACGLDGAQVLAAIHTFKGLKHRQQLVGIKNGISFINDSKATNADATSKALACYDNIYWIVGGEPKSDELNGLEIFYNRIKHTYLIGVSAPRFAEILSGFGVAHTICGTIENATQKAFEQAFADASGNNANILLSPACASFDQYKNFEQRGDDFITHAEKIINS
jgi:UDP-N-acetylmuramoylalanine--D-glutamate ligase